MRCFLTDDDNDMEKDITEETKEVEKIVEEGNGDKDEGATGVKKD